MMQKKSLHFAHNPFRNVHLVITGPLTKPPVKHCFVTAGWLID